MSDVRVVTYLQINNSTGDINSVIEAETALQAYRELYRLYPDTYNNYTLYVRVPPIDKKDLQTIHAHAGAASRKA